MHMHSIDKTHAENHPGGWGKTYGDRTNWKEYNEELVIWGKMILDMDFRDQWNAELRKMNGGKGDRHTDFRSHS